MINTITGVTYFEAPDNGMGCMGCVAETNSRLCAQLQQTKGEINYCADHDVIWIEQAKPITFDIKILQTSQGPLQPTAVEGNKPCRGCAAQHDTELCNEISDYLNCVQNPGTIWLRVRPKLVPGVAEAIELLVRESTLTEVLEYCKANKLNFRT